MKRRWLPLLPAWPVLLVLGGIIPKHASADSTVTCTRLSALPDSGANYILTATASGNGNSITGYTFDFSDHQSYTVTFSQKTSQDHYTARVTHAYQKDGVYTPGARVNIKDNGKSSSISSKACQTTLTIGSSSNTLPNTGAGNTYRLFAVAVLGSVTLYQLRLRRRVRATLRK